MDAGGNFNYSGVAPAASTTVNGITVTCLSGEAINKELSTLPADVFPKDPGIGEKMAVHFCSSISSGDIAAAKSDMATLDGYLVKQGDPIGKIAYHVKTDGRITEIQFTQFGPSGGRVGLSGTMTFADKKQWDFTVVESAFNLAEPSEKQHEEYSSGKWHVIAVRDLYGYQSNTPP